MGEHILHARALTAGPDLPLCDEITSVLDPDTAIAVAVAVASMELPQRLWAERNMALAIVSHETQVPEVA
ncbi:hypothetical protein ACFRAO_08255 [Streptomyces sp. NPDC056656]|uniref:hypothetical protein n=1 Tax=Streptomyces sp. NPDC056656 TaxID=3345895 RepID=UPI0036C99F7C